MEACQVRLWLTKRNLKAANQWAKERCLDEKEDFADRKLDYVSELEWIGMARLHIARGELERALSLLTTLDQAAEAAGRNGRRIEILVLMALALHGAGRTTQALDVLAKSLAMAEPEGFMRLFLDEGRPMEELLQACHKRAEGSLKAYTRKLLDAFNRSASGEVELPAACSTARSLVEPLTGREIEVLRLLAAGLSNREMAERLYLSEGTVKTHTHNLYQKLGVQSRTRAIARAKEFGLL